VPPVVDSKDKQFSCIDNGRFMVLDLHGSSRRVHEIDVAEGRNRRKRGAS
jgi:hypothetical protein